jgi:hypothetical protein
MDEPRELTIYRACGIWDLLLTVSFAVPPLAAFDLSLLRRLHVALGGAREFPAFEPLHVFFVSMFGIMCVIWAVIRVHRPSRLLALYDTVGRFAVASFMIGFTLAGVSPVVAFFSVSEIGWGVVQGIVLLRARGRAKAAA